MKLARRLTLAALAAMLVLPASAGAKLEFNLPSQIFKVFDESGKSDVDPQRCVAIVFIEFPKIKRAVGYRITWKDSRTGELEDLVAPPFDTIGRGFITRFPPPKGFARFFLGAYSTGEGCAAADAMTENAKIVESKVSLDKPFQKRFKKVDKPPWRCTFKPGDRTVKLGRRGDGRKIIVRRQGEVTTIDKGSVQPVNLNTNRYAGSGTIVKTGPKAIVKIGALDGSSVLVGPNMTVRITDTGLEVVEQPRHVRPWRVPHKPGQDYKVRTCSAVSAVRG
jgi:hypothetical protein